MALAAKVGLSTSGFFCSTVLQSAQCESHCKNVVGYGPNLVTRAYPQLVCQLEGDQSQTTAFDVSRRWFVAVTASGTTLGVLGQPEAQAAGRRKPTPPEEKKEEEDKGLSAYDQKLLASYRRKEAFKLSIEEKKAKGKSVASNL